MWPNSLTHICHLAMSDMIKESCHIWWWHHAGVMAWKRSLNYWPFVMGIHRHSACLSHKVSNYELGAFFVLVLFTYWTNSPMGDINQLLLMMITCYWTYFLYKIQYIVTNIRQLLLMHMHHYQWNNCCDKKINTGTIERLIQGVSFYGVVKS